MNIRMLAALDIVLHGPRLILIEFSAGVGIPLLIGLVVLFRSHGLWQDALGWYMLALALNYVPLLVHAFSLGTQEKAVEEVEAAAGPEWEKELPRYGHNSFLLLLPLIVPAMALIQALKRRRATPGV